MKSVVFALASLAALGFVNAQDTTDTAAPAIPTSACIITCLTQAATTAQCSFTDTSCACENATFQSSATQCLTSTCTADEVAQAQALQQQVCGTTSPATSGGATETGTTTGTGSTTTNTSPSTSTTTGTGTGAPQTTTSNAAMGMMAPPALVGAGGVVGGLVGVVGAVVGALVVV